MTDFDVQSIAIEAPAGRAFDYIADPRNLPRWTHAFKEADHASALMRAPQGSVRVGLAVRANREAGTVDWEMLFPDGARGLAHSRIVPNGEARAIYTFVLKAPPVAQERIEGALAEQRGILAGELRRLKEILEA
jgi:polyketide cyclase/dehydrase/lipid transport protein